jgi:hypothetical protein
MQWFPFNTLKDQYRFKNLYNIAAQKDVIFTAMFHSIRTHIHDINNIYIQLYFSMDFGKGDMTSRTMSDRCNNIVN